MSIPTLFELCVSVIDPSIIPGTSIIDNTPFWEVLHKKAWDVVQLEIPIAVSEFFDASKYESMVRNHLSGRDPVFGDFADDWDRQIENPEEVYMDIFKYYGCGDFDRISDIDNLNNLVPIPEDTIDIYNYYMEVLYSFFEKTGSGSIIVSRYTLDITWRHALFEITHQTEYLNPLITDTLDYAESMEFEYIRDDWKSFMNSPTSPTDMKIYTRVADHYGLHYDHLLAEFKGWRDPAREAVREIAIIARG